VGRVNVGRPRRGLEARAIWLLAAALVLILAAGLRWHDLDAQSLWNDEGNSLRLAQRSVPDLLAAAARDIHPPGYYLALKGWIALVGTSEFALRALSALQGVLTAAVALRLGRRLFGPLAGALAGLLVALSPFAVYYSQEARMYAQLGLLSAASMALLAEWLRAVTSPPGPLSSQAGEGERDERISSFRAGLRYALALALVNAAGLYTQYSYPFSLIAQGILVAAWLLWLRGAARRALLVYAALNGLTLLLFLPWLPTAWDQVTSWPRTGVPLALADQLRTVLTWITYGNTAGDVPWLRLLWPGLLALAAFLPGGPRRTLPHGWRAALPAVWGGVVIASLLVSGAYREANLKFLLPAQVAAAVLIGAGAARLWRLAPTRRVGRLSARQTRYTARLVALVAGVLIVVGQADALRALYRDPAYARADYRGIAAFIRAHTRPGDAVILDAPNQAEVFSYYASDEWPIYPLPRGLGGDDAQTRAEVEAVLASHARVWVVFWGEAERDPNRVVQAALDAGAYPVTTAWYGDVRLAQYAVLGLPPATAQASSRARFGDHIRLTGYTLSSDHLAPGDVLGVALFWTTDAPLAARYQVTVQLFAPDGSLVSQHDAEPADNRAPTSAWTPGEIVLDPHGLPIPLGQPSGAYRVIVAVYDPAAPLQRLPVALSGAAQADVLSLGTVEVVS